MSSYFQQSKVPRLQRNLDFDVSCSGIKEHLSKASFCPDNPAKGNPRRRRNRQLTADSTNRNALQLQEMWTSNKPRKQKTDFILASTQFKEAIRPSLSRAGSWGLVQRVGRRDGSSQRCHRPTHKHIHTIYGHQLTELGCAWTGEGNQRQEEQTPKNGGKYLQVQFLKSVKECVADRCTPWRFSELGWWKVCS